MGQVIAIPITITGVVDNVTLEASAGKIQIKDDGVTSAKINDGEIVEDDLSVAVQRSLVPVGAILSWAKTITGVPSLPSNFVQCDGQTLSDADSPIDGQVIPDLNGGDRFLRGASSSGATGGEDTTANHTHVVSKPGVEASGTGATGYTGQTNATAQSNGTHSNLPSYYAVVWIMRIK